MEHRSFRRSGNHAPEFPPRGYTLQGAGAEAGHRDTPIRELVHPAKWTPPLLPLNPRNHSPAFEVGGSDAKRRSAAEAKLAKGGGVEFCTRGMLIGEMRGRRRSPADARILLLHQINNCSKASGPRAQGDTFPLGEKRETLSRQFALNRGVLRRREFGIKFDRAREIACNFCGSIWCFAVRAPPVNYGRRPSDARKKSRGTQIKGSCPIRGRGMIACSFCAFVGWLVCYSSQRPSCLSSSRLPTRRPSSLPRQTTTHHPVWAAISAHPPLLSTVARLLSLEPAVVSVCPRLLAVSPARARIRLASAINRLLNPPQPDNRQSHQHPLAPHLRPNTTRISSSHSPPPPRPFQHLLRARPSPDGPLASGSTLGTRERRFVISIRLAGVGGEEPPGARARCLIPRLMICV